jgi:hypothetical protein
MPAWIAGIQVRKDASGNIHFNLDSSTPCWNDAIEVFYLNPQECLRFVFSKESMSLEILNRPFMFLGCFETAESAQIPAFTGFWILLARVQPVYSGFELANHGATPPNSELFELRQFGRQHVDFFEHRRLGQ